MRRLRWISLQLVEHVGWPGVAAVLLLLMASVQYVVAFRPLQLEMQAITASTPAISSVAGIEDAPSDQLGRFQSFFRDRDLESQLHGLHEAGASTGVNIKRVEYRLLEERRANLRQYQIVMPVTQSYPVIRRFVAESLHKVPALALDHITFTRKRVGDAQVDAELRFTLYLADAR